MLMLADVESRSSLADPPHSHDYRLRPHGRFDCPDINNLFALDVGDLLRLFKRPVWSWFRHMSEHALPSMRLRGHGCALFRVLLELCKGERNRRPTAFDPERTTTENMQIYACFVGAGAMADVGFGKFQIQDMRSALARSQAFANIEQSTVSTWIARIKRSLPVWYPDGHMVRRLEESGSYSFEQGIPLCVLKGLGTGHVDEMRIYV